MFQVLKEIIDLMKDLRYEHQNIKVGGWWCSWRVHCVGGGGVHGGMGGWRVNGVGAFTHPPMNSYNVKRFNFMNTHPPIKHIQSVTLLLYIYSPMHEQL